MQTEERYRRWKVNVPLLYDWFTNHNLTWPSLSCRWGPVVEQRCRQQLYLSEQTTGNYPNTIVVVNCEIPKPRAAPFENLSQFNEEHKSPYVKKVKTIIHPGEVNRIREMPQRSEIVATHTDKPEVYIWNLESQPNRPTTQGVSPSTPDMVLMGHTANAEYALALSPSSELVLSGGKDRHVLLWDIKEPMGTLKPPGRQTLNSGGYLPTKSTTPHVPPTGTFRGHTKTVEDVQFRPSRPHEFCSVSDDRSLILWDSRQGSTPAAKVTNAHDDDVHCVDWNAHEENYILTGSADKSVRLFDRRKLGSQFKKFEGHKSSVLCVQWCPAKASVFASSGDDAVLNIWDYEKMNENVTTEKKHPDGLFFQHAGHRDQIIDFHWNPLEQWTLASLSTDSKGGSTLQIWRVCELLYRPEDEIIEELKQLENELSTPR